MNNNNEDKKSLAEEQIETLDPVEEIVIKDKDGKERTAKTELPLRKKFRLNRIIGEMMKRMPGLNATDGEVKLSVGEFVSAGMGEELIDIVNIIFNIPVNVIETKFAEEEIIEKILPFFLSRATDSTVKVVNSLTLRKS